MKASLPIIVAGVLVLGLFAVGPAQGQASAGSFEGESFRHDRVRATEALNPANPNRGVHEARRRSESRVRVLHRSEAGQPAYVYQVNGRERVSVAAPRRVDAHRQPVRVQPRQVDASNHTTNRRINTHRNVRAMADEMIERRERSAAQGEAAEQRGDTAAHSASEASEAAEEAEPVLREVGRYAYPQAVPAGPTAALHVTPGTAHLHAREQAEAAVQQARHERHVKRDVYAGYRHKPRSRATVQLYSSYDHSYDHRRHVYYHHPSVHVHHHYHHRHSPRFRGGFYHHRRAGFHCPPVRRHHHSRTGASMSLHFRF